MFGKLLNLIRSHKTLSRVFHWGSEPDVITADQIGLCYEIVLGRTADEGGLAHFLAVATARNIKSPHSIAKMLYTSDEFRSRFGTGPSIDVFENIKEVEYQGLKLRLPEEDDVFREITASGTYEPHVLLHLLANIREADVFVDIGANLGALSLPVAKRVGPRGQVLAFEPSQRNILLLIKNAAANKLSNVQAYPIGLSDYNGTALSWIDSHMSNKSLIDLPASELSDGMEVIPVMKLDAFLQSDAKIDVIKIDVEGFEYKVIRGAIETISRWKPRIYLEYSDTYQRFGSGVPGKKLLQLLHDIGYVPTILHRHRPPETLEGLGKRAVAAADEAWEKCVAEGGTHLDLYCTPVEGKHT